MVNNTFIFSSLVSDIQEVGNSAYLLEQVQEEKKPQQINELLTHFEDFIEQILEEIKYLKKTNKFQERSLPEDIYNECA